MLYISDIKITRFILSGIRCVGWADAEDALTFPSQELVVAKQGADGGMAFGVTGKIGGEVITKFLPNSPTVPAFNDLFNQQKYGLVTLFNGTGFFSDSSTVEMLNGVMTTAPSGYTQGNAVAAIMQYHFMFQQIVFSAA